MTGRWYITIAAVREWMRLTGRGGSLEDTNPAFSAAQAELFALSLTASRSPQRGRDGSESWRGYAVVDGRRRRVECSVMPLPRKEGKLPQLVRVRLK